MVEQEEKIQPKDKYSIYLKPDVQKVYTVPEIAKYLECTELEVRNVADYYHIKKIIVPTAKSRAAVFNWDSVRQIKEQYEARQKRIRDRYLKTHFQKKEPDITEEDHTLVTDKRCLELNYWPDVVPECFKECEEC
jgi:hypothetical protein